MTPIELFETYCPRVDEISETLCWHYQVSGALSFQEEAKSEARMALWRCCQAFDPHKQVMQRRKYADQEFWAVLFQVPFQLTDPYGNFWIASVTRIRGSVIDFFRSQRLITKMSPGMKPTLLYQDKFLSLNRPLRTGGEDSFADHLPAKDFTEEKEELEHIRMRVSVLKRDAGLTDLEREVIERCFSEGEYSKKEVAMQLDVPFAKIQTTLTTALGKLRAASVLN